MTTFQGVSNVVSHVKRTPTTPPSPHYCSKHHVGTLTIRSFPRGLAFIHIQLKKPSTPLTSRWTLHKSSRTVQEECTKFHVFLHNPLASASSSPAAVNRFPLTSRECVGSNWAERWKPTDLRWQHDTTEAPKWLNATFALLLSLLSATCPPTPLSLSPFKRAGCFVLVSLQTTRHPDPRSRGQSGMARL